MQYEISCITDSGKCNQYSRNVRIFALTKSETIRDIINLSLLTPDSIPSQWLQFKLLQIRCYFSAGVYGSLKWLEIEEQQGEPFNLLNSAAITLPELFTVGNASGDVKINCSKICSRP